MSERYPSHADFTKWSHADFTGVSFPHDTVLAGTFLFLCIHLRWSPFSPVLLITRSPLSALHWPLCFSSWSTTSSLDCGCHLPPLLFQFESSPHQVGWRSIWHQLTWDWVTGILIMWWWHYVLNEVKIHCMSAFKDSTVKWLGIFFYFSY